MKTYIIVSTIYPNIDYMFENLANILYEDEDIKNDVLFADYYRGTIEIKPDIIIKFVSVGNVNILGIRPDYYWGDSGYVDKYLHDQGSEKLDTYDDLVAKIKEIKNYEH